MIFIKYIRIRKDERHGEKCRAKTMMHSGAGEAYKNVRTSCAA
jgi:hypothetical protein